jgi:uncharacterized protein CbrC (UPF0167 family)
MKTHNFRSWLQDKWYEHIDEMISYTGKEPEYRAKEYFNKYKHWLKREYRFQQENSLLNQ